MVLNGIMIAATNGSKFPDNAKDNPTTLYINESVKLILIVVIAFFDSIKKQFSFLNSEASKIASQAGEKTFTFSEIEIPILL